MAAFYARVKAGQRMREEKPKMATHKPGSSRIRVRRVVISGGKFMVARKLADAGIPFRFVKEAGLNTVGEVPRQHLTKLSTFLTKHPEMEGRFAKHPSRRGEN